MAKGLIPSSTVLLLPSLTRAINSSALRIVSSIWAQKPLDNQKNTITAQNRKYPDQNTGISIHASRIVAAADLEPVKSNYSTYLCRPWKMYSRTVYMMSYIGDHINPVGWLEWNNTFALDTLYYAEYNNYGPGSAVDKRVAWPGYRVITAPQEAAKFTVSQFIFGTSWLPSTGGVFVWSINLLRAEKGDNKDFRYIAPKEFQAMGVQFELS
ncbi:putative pectinesterase/pectinesterase inhibitor 34 [Carex littledalei]|uniref:Putative pectinesterase/pectinesterase inhibitor 34 n=1 Tax=Carex littledalei TaxID=544730 RepID=A0A833QGX4_9POAL|nr:putative pectinesterase/pectinesterase inhibitor 34 [Carex littledalei]